GDPSSPLRFLQVGLVAAVAWALHGLLGARTIPSTVTLIAGETLVIYYVHVMVLYASGLGVAALVGPHLSLFPTLAAVLLAWVLCAALAIAWSRLKRRAATARRPRGRRGASDGP
ncbi:MAG: hypothetical protein KC416_02920, partial [Myxococcales bacterium]|nr:hypothetical protein [Myxococcales bacterium]